MRHLVGQAGLGAAITLDSAGMGDWHVGGARDARSSEVGRRRGMPLGGVARQFQRADFARFDYVLAMDRSNRDQLLLLAPDDAARAKVSLLRAFDAAAPADAEVPDPYYGGPDGFDNVFAICEVACRGLLDHLCRQHNLSPVVGSKDALGQIV